MDHRNRINSGELPNPVFRLFYEENRADHKHAHAGVPRYQLPDILTDSLHSAHHVGV